MSNLISVMIVEDEKLTLEDLCSIVDWESCGYKIVTTAYNGKQGLKKYREFRPQLIFTDIRMPFMDGIEMIAKIRETDDKVNIVLLTAYEDFGYAKAAISLGITEYLIKSEITAESMKAFLRRLSADIIRQSQNEKILTNRMLEQFFLSESMSENPDIDRFLNKMFYLILVEQDLPLNLNGEINQEFVTLPKLKLVDMLSHGNYEEWMLEAITSLPGGQVVLALESRNKAFVDKRRELYACAERIRQYLSGQTMLSFTVYVIENRTTLYRLKRYCDENKRVFLKKYFEGCGKVQKLPYPILTEQGVEKRTWELDEDFWNFQNPDILCESLQDIFQVIQTGRDIRQLRDFSRECFQMLKDAYQQFPAWSAIGGSILEHQWSDWLDAETICAWLQRQVHVLNECMQAERSHYSRPVMEAMDYVCRNFRNPNLSLNDIADHVHLSVGYLSGAFKKEAGCTLKSYITDKRIQEAKRLIEKGSYKIYEIGSMVGYHSSQYFSQAFYKKVGMFPTEYQKKE